MSTEGRLLGIGPTDNTSDQRTPRQRLRLIPDVARDQLCAGCASALCDKTS